MRLIVKARQTVKPAPAPISGVDVRLIDPAGSPTDVLLAATEAGRYEANTPKPVAGNWQAVVSVHREGLADAVTQLVWTAEGKTPDSLSALEYGSTAVALGLLIALAGSLVVVRRRRDRERPAGVNDEDRERANL